jgi:hypothetical protein
VYRLTAFVQCYPHIAFVQNWPKLTSPSLSAQKDREIGAQNCGKDDEKFTE